MCFATMEGSGWMTIRLLPLQLDPGFKPYAVGLVTSSYLLHEKTRLNFSVSSSPGHLLGESRAH